MKGNIKKIILFLVLPLAIGGVLYYFFCPEVFFVKKMDSLFNINIHLTVFDSLSKPIRFVRNYFFDLLWAYALAGVICLFCDNNAHAVWGSIVGATLLGAAMEILQLIGVAPGTFDFWDIFVECLGAMAGVLIIKTTRRNKNEKR